MAESAFEPGETEVLRHLPLWIDLCLVALILLAEFAVLSSVSERMAARPTADDQAALTLTIVTALFVGSVLQFLILAMPPLVEVTDRRILRRRRLGWDDPEEMRLESVESIRQQGWRLVVTGGGKSIMFFCPPLLAARIRKATG